MEVEAEVEVKGYLTVVQSQMDFDSESQMDFD